MRKNVQQLLCILPTKHTFRLYEMIYTKWFDENDEVQQATTIFFFCLSLSIFSVPFHLKRNYRLGGMR